MRQRKPAPLAVTFFAFDYVWAGAVHLIRDLLSMPASIGLREPQAPIAARVASINGDPVRSFNGVPLSVDGAIGDCRGNRLIVLPPIWGYRPDLIHHPDVAAWLRTEHQAGAWILGVTSGVYYAAEAGLLDGGEATTHWSYLRDMQARYPAIRLYGRQAVTRHNRVLCCSGLNAVFQSIHFLIQAFLGEQAARQMARYAYAGLPFDDTAPFLLLESAKTHADALVREIQRWVDEHHADITDLADLTAQFPVSTRTLHRRFRQATGRSPGEYLRLVRMEYARHWLCTTRLPVQAVGHRVGIEDANTFTRQFREETGTTPRAFRALRGA